MADYAYHFDGISFAPGWDSVPCDDKYPPLCEKSCEGCTLDHGKSDKATFIFLNLF